MAGGDNAPGTGDTEEKFYDSYGRLIWRKDGDAYIHYTAYDNLTGAATKRIKNVKYASLDGGEQSAFANTGWDNPTASTNLHLSTVYVNDELGRSTKITDPRGNSTYIIYKDADHEYRVYTAWSTSSHTTVGPTFVRREDWDKGYVEKFTMSAAPSYNGSNLPDGGETVGSLQTLYRESTNTGGQITKVDRYFNLAGLTYSTSTSLGTSGTHFYRTELAYDSLGRNNKITLPTGTIQKYAIDSLGRTITEAVGTDDGSPGNMSILASYEYDDADPYDTLSGGVGDGNLTRITRAVDSDTANDRMSVLIYDWRNRAVLRKDGARTSLSNETDDNSHPITYIEYDNEDRVTLIERYDGEYTDATPALQHTSFAQDSGDEVPNQPANPNLDGLTGHELLTQKQTFSYDNRGRLWKKITVSVNPSTGDEGQELSTAYWYGRRGQIIRMEQPGGLVTETVFDGAGRRSIIYYSDGLGGSGWDDASTPEYDTVLEQIEYGYDENGNLTLVTRKQRFHDQTSTSAGYGALNDASASTRKARVSYTSYYFDDANRATKKVVVGTNGASSYSRPASESDSDNDRSDTRLVTTYTYDSNDIQIIIITGNPTGGTFTLTLDGQTTSSLARNASAACWTN